MVRLTILVLSFFTFHSLFATHNRAGEIIYRQIDELTIQASIITYTLPSSVSADRDTVQINWGDGSSQWILRVNGLDVDSNGIPDGELLDNGYKKNVYIAEHKYGQSGSFKLSMKDPNREHEILNINFPNPDAIAFFIETLVVLDAAINNSPVVLQPPLDIGFVNTPFVFYPSAFDVDDDSIAYRLVTPLMDEDQPVTNYQSPMEINPGANNLLTLDQVTGRLFWQSPQLEGIYNIAIEMLTYRDGELNGSVLRDMQILVLPEENALSSVSSMPDYNQITEVEVGDTINIQVDAMDVDFDQDIRISLTSGLVDYFSEAPTFNFVHSNSNVEDAFFSWIVKAEHIRKHPYDVVFRSVDNLGLAGYKQSRFRVKDIIESTGEATSIEPFEIFPNPVEQTIFIKNKIAGSRKYQLFSADGRLVKIGQLVQNNTIDAHDLALGLYYLKLEGQGVRSFIKK